MKRIIAWFKHSNRYKHLGLGCLVGLGADSWYCAAYVGASVAGAMEFKDRAHGCKWDWIDFGLTVTGVMAGYTVRFLIIKAL